MTIITSWRELIIVTMSAVFRLLERELRERDAPGAWERRSLGASEREIGTPGGYVLSSHSRLVSFTIGDDVKKRDKYCLISVIRGQVL